MAEERLIYLDNAATSWPKPKTVGEAMVHFLEKVGANPGRAGHRLSIESGRIVNEARELVAKLFNEDNPLRVVFGLNATDGLNLGMRGLVKKGDHVITSSMEHNSVLRPLNDLKAQGIDYTVIRCSKEGFLRPEDVVASIRKDTKLIVMNHGSNIVGSLLPLREVGKIASENDIPFLIDAAQTGGCIPIDMKADHVDMVAFTGHKGLLGPMGTGGLVVGPKLDEKKLDHIRSGGTGSKSEYEVQPGFFPDKYESGTLNTVGLAGLVAGLEFIFKETVERIHQHELRLTQRLIDGLVDIPHLTLYGGKDAKRQTPTMSINVEGLMPSDLGLILDDDYGVLTRVGLHCAPMAHRTIGTLPQGTVRLACGYFSTEEHVDFTIDALKEIVSRKRD